MGTYNFTRELASGKYNVNNQYCIDGESKPVPLFKEIKADVTLPDDFTIKCEATNCSITFSGDLDGTQQATLTSIINAHKAHTEG